VGYMNSAFGIQTTAHPAGSIVCMIVRPSPLPVSVLVKADGRVLSPTAPAAFRVGTQSASVAAQSFPAASSREM